MEDNDLMLLEYIEDIIYDHIDEGTFAYGIIAGDIVNDIAKDILSKLPIDKNNVV